MKAFFRPARRPQSAPSAREPVGLRVWAGCGALAGALLALLVFAPARWLSQAVLSASGQQVLLAEARGTVWRGSARLALTGGTGSQDISALPERVRWTLRPTFSGLRVDLLAECCTPKALELRATPRLGGLRVELADARAVWPAALLAGLGTPWNTLQPSGQMIMQSRGLSADWSAGRVLLSGSAVLDAQNIGSRLSTLQPMGSYRLSLQGGGRHQPENGNTGGQPASDGQWAVDGLAPAVFRRGQRRAGARSCAGEFFKHHWQAQWRAIGHHPRLTPMKKYVTFLIAIGAVLSLTSASLHAQNAAGARRNEQVTLSFNNADIAEVARTIAVITGRSVVVDPRVRGTMTLNTDKPVSKAVAYNQFLATLRLQGFTVVETEGLSKVVPEADAKLQGGRVSIGAAPTGPGNQIVTQIFHLNYEAANNLVPVLRPLISPNNTINVNPGNNSLVITDYTDNLQRLARIIAALDVSNASDIEIIPLKNAIATDLVPLVVRLLESGGGPAAGPGQTDTSFRTTLLAEPRGNSLILRAANPARLALVRALVEKLDRPPQSGAGPAGGNIHVVHLKNADATQLAITLRGALSSESSAAASTTSGVGALQVQAPPSGVSRSGTGAAATGPSGSLAARQPTTGGQIQADPATNSLIITAPDPQYRQLRAVIDKLDTRRAQVFVESLIVEVNADKAAEFGIQWQGPLGRAGDSLIGLLGTNFGSGGNNILNLATQGLTGAAPVAPGPGFNFGALRRTDGVYVLGFLARFLEQSGNGNILSTPNLLMLDNEEAKIVIGQNVPFITGQFTNTGGGNIGSVNPFQTIERKDVGLTLRVRPQISENGTVKLTIFQEVSSVQASSVNSPSGLITNKRSIESTVLVDDGAIVVLGGLLQDEYSGNQEKVPGLGDIPFFGNLFKSESRGRKKTNLMVFLRPVVLRDAQKTDSVTLDRYELMRGLQLDAQPPASVIVPINDALVLPSLPPARPPSTLPMEPPPTSAPARAP